MRLINIDDIDFERLTRILGKTTTKDVRRVIESTPITNAIPMQFIKDFQNYTIGELRWNRVNELVDAWEEQNE